MRPPVALAYASGLAITSLSRLGLARHAVFNEQQAIAGLTSSTDSFDWTTVGSCSLQRMSKVDEFDV